MATFGIVKMKKSTPDGGPMNQRDAFIERLKDSLAEWNAEIERWPRGRARPASRPASAIRKTSTA